MRRKLEGIVASAALALCLAPAQAGARVPSPGTVESAAAATASGKTAPVKQQKARVRKLVKRHKLQANYTGVSKIKVRKGQVRVRIAGTGRPTKSLRKHIKRARALGAKVTWVKRPKTRQELRADAATIRKHPEVIGTWIHPMGNYIIVSFKDSQFSPLSQSALRKELGVDAEVRVSWPDNPTPAN